MEETKKTGYRIREHVGPTKRYCQTLELRDDPALIAEYRRIHSEARMWHEIMEGIRSVGILEMDIYIFGTKLFMIVETALDFEWDTAMARLATLPRQAEWEELTGRYQKVSEGATSDEKWQLMERIFHLYS